VEPDAYLRQEWGNAGWNPDDFHLRLRGCGDPPQKDEQNDITHFRGVRNVRTLN